MSNIAHVKAISYAVLVMVYNKNENLLRDLLDKYMDRALTKNRQYRHA